MTARKSPARKPAAPKKSAAAETVDRINRALDDLLVAVATADDSPEFLDLIVRLRLRASDASASFYPPAYHAGLIIEAVIGAVEDAEGKERKTHG